MAAEQQLAVTSDFLTKTSLYEKQTGKTTNNPGLFTRGPSFDLYCPACDGIKTMTSDGVVVPWTNPREQDLRGAILRYDYTCAGCRKFSPAFFIQIAEDLTYMSKVGQYPPIDISIDSETRQKLGAHIELYKKGRICEGHGYGIAAFAYYRRINELIIDDLMKEIEDLVEEAQREEYKKALHEIKKSHHASDKIELIKHLIPSSLKPSGSNPIGILYGVLSAGLHEEDEKECLEKAHAIRGTLENFIHLLNANKRAATEFKASMGKLLSPKKNK